MCGLVGVLSKSYNGFSNKERDVFHELLYIDVVRGDDSTGAMLVDRDGNLELAKEATDAQNFQRSAEYQALMTKAFREGSALIGHNRKATRGVVNDENAHPFVVDDRIVLVHNGTLWGDHKKIANVEVDSHAIAHLIHQHEDDVEAALKEINGAYALIWYDVQKRTMNFVRNASRPLCFVETSSAWLWASEPGMLAWMVGRHDMTIQGKLEVLPVGELHSFAREGNRWAKSVRKLDLTVQTTTYTPTPTTRIPDHCDMRPNFRPFGNPWVNADDDEDSFIDVTGTTTVLLPPPANKPPFRIETARVKFSPEESALARKNGFVLTHNAFSKAIESIADGSFVAGVPFDYDYVKGDNCLSGLFMYAKASDDPDIMIRCYIPYHAGSGMDIEQTVLNLCTSERACMFKVLSRQWHKHAEGDVNEGCGIIYSKEYGVTTKLVEKAANEGAI